VRCKFGFAFRLSFPFAFRFAFRFALRFGCRRGYRLCHFRVLDGLIFQVLFRLRRRACVLRKRFAGKHEKIVVSGRGGGSGVRRLAFGLDYRLRPGLGGSFGTRGIVLGIGQTSAGSLTTLTALTAAPTACTPAAAVAAVAYIAPVAALVGRTTGGGRNSDNRGRNYPLN
jgi:hypothetical protein